MAETAQMTTDAPVEMKISDEVAIRIENMNKWYGSFHVLRDIDLTVHRGERIVIAGPSGSGKSTLIRCINALEEHQKGRIEVDGTLLSSDIKNIDTIRSEVGMVFQHFNLFLHRTALENVIEAPMLVKGQSRGEATERARDLLAKVGLAAKADAYPAQLSGGQQQRVAIARALAMDPDFLLFDEPTSALDPELAAEVVAVLASLAEENRTLVVVTHSLAFARRVADRVVFLEDGHVLQDGTPDEFFRSEDQRLRRFREVIGSV